MVKNVSVFSFYLIGKVSVTLDKYFVILFAFTTGAIYFVMFKISLIYYDCSGLKRFVLLASLACGPLKLHFERFAFALVFLINFSPDNDGSFNIFVAMQLS